VIRVAVDNNLNGVIELVPIISPEAKATIYALDIIPIKFRAKSFARKTFSAN